MHVGKVILLASYVKVLHMNNTVMVRLGKEENMINEKYNVLTESVCKSIFPISIICENERIIGYYKTGEYKRISEYSNLTAESILTFIEKFLLAIEECNQYLIFVDEYVINSNTVYVDKDFNNVKITYIPDIRRLKESIKLKFFVKELKRITTSSGIIYLDMLEELLEIEGISYLKIRHFAAKLRHEARRKNSDLCDERYSWLQG